MDEKEEVLSEIEKFLKRHNQDINVELINTYNIQGRCLFKKNTIQISFPAYVFNNKKGKEALLMHEIIHLENQTHNLFFKSKMRNQGYNDKDIIPIYKYMVLCPNCKQVLGLNHIRKKYELRCQKCSKENGKQPAMLYKHMWRK